MILKGVFLRFFMYFFQHCFIFRLSDSDALEHSMPPQYQKTREVGPTSVVGWLCPLCTRRPGRGTYLCGGMAVPPLYQKTRGGGPTYVVG
jgi:hypothetical protein